MTGCRLRWVCRFVLAAAFSSTFAFAQTRHVAPVEFRDWPQITEAEKQMRTLVVEKDAGAELLVWNAYVVDEFLSRNTLQRVFYNYIRLKVFTDKGKEQVATIDLTSTETSNITPDEVPPPMKAETPYGKFDATWTVTDTERRV